MAEPRKRRHPAESPREAADVVRLGGVADNDAETEDVTRDTYGFPASSGVARSRKERIAEANRAAEEAGLPGVEIPEEEPGEEPGSKPSGAAHARRRDHSESNED